MKLLRAVGIGVVASGLATGSVVAGSAGGAERAHYYSHPHASVIIKRSPNLGYLQHVRFYVDGRLLTVLGYGRFYEGTLPAGEHLVVMRQVPHLNDAYPVSSQRIRVVPGRPNVFTATWVNGGSRLALEES